MKKSTLLSLLLASFCMLGFSSLQAQRGLILSTKIAADTDDAEERGLNASSNPGLIDLTSSDIELVQDGGDGNQFVGLRFASVNLPANAIIDSAFIQFVVDETNTGATSVTIKAEDEDSSVTFAAVTNNISSRSTTTDSVNWNNIPAWTVVGQNDNDQRTPDISVLVNSIVGRSGWNQGNPITFIITGSGERTAEAYNATGAQAAELIIYYSLPQTTTFTIAAGSDDAEEDLTNGSIDLGSSDLELVTENADQAIGMRFTNVTIPQGATILNAYIQFQTDEITTTGNVDVLLLVEDNVNPSTYTAATNNITSRTYDQTTAFVWNVNGWPTIGVKGADQRTPDLSAMVQRIVDNQNWFAGNPMAFGAIDPVYLSLPTYTGNSGRRTAESFNGSGGPELIVEYLAPLTYTNGGFPISRGSSWKYDDSGADLGTAWTANNYNDTTWAFGDAILGYGNSNEATSLDFGPSATDKHITTYLRHTFNGDGTAIYDSLIFEVLRDDGVIVYINGVEAFRSNMPSGTVGFDTLASSTVGGAAETTYYTFVVDNTLTPGLNTIAVELHQADSTSSDLSFDMGVIGKLPPLATSNFPVVSGDEWNYLDNGSDLGSANWTAVNYNDTNWAYGPSSLGYGDPQNTTISFGPNGNDKYITYYFRKRFDVSNLNAVADSLILGLKRDDGGIVYLNGVEIFRSNMPAGPVNYLTTSSTIVSGGDEDRFFNTVIHKSALIQGTNILAVEIHQRDSSSSDLTFDLELVERPKSRNACTGINDLHISCYTSLFPDGQDPDFYIPATHAFQVLLEQGDSYTNQSVRTTAPGNNDFTGYVGRSGSSTTGFVGVNHENTPGGVSIIDIHYDNISRLWVVDSTAAVDFYNNDLVTTTRNCSGGITPWGTIITSEETTNSGDANSDGYEDVGWQVEIDPVTRLVKEYGTPGKQEKLWAMGRMSHENIAVANDSITAYQGEDAGSGCFYKFVADNPMDLSTGKLYALRLDSGLIGGEPVVSTARWIQIPNTTAADRNATRSLALSLGATPFNGIEDAEIGTIDGKIYFTSKGYNRVYRFSDDSDTTASQFETFVGAKSYLINYGAGVVSEPWASGNDNLCFDDLGNLYVLQDGSRDHVWMVGPNHTQANPVVDIFAKLPSGSEPCGMTFTPDYKFMFLSVQHPSSGNASTFQIDAAGDTVRMNRSVTLVIARKEFLGSYSPMTPSSNLVFNTAACDTIGLSFSTGSGNGRLVVAKEASIVDAFPMDGITYNANQQFGSGDELGTGNFVVYDGNAASTSILGLQPNTEYHVSIFEYNASPNKFYDNSTYLVDSATTAAVGTAAIVGNFNTTVNASETYSVPNTTGSTYQWDAGMGTITSGQGSNQIQVSWPSIAGNSDLTVVETNNRSCIGDTVLQNVVYGLVGIEEVNLDEAMVISPNPTNGTATIMLNGVNDTYDVLVTDMMGKEVLKASNLNRPFTIDLEGKEKGMYMVQIRLRNQVSSKILVLN